MRFLAPLSALVVASCGPSTEANKMETTTPAVATKEFLYQRGHKFYLQLNFDSAQVVLSQALALDAGYKDVIADLAPLHYDLALRSEAAKKKNELLRKSRDYYMKLEALGTRESEVYERLCEIASMLNDEKTFLKYAKKNADAYPYDRQYYNLSVAYFNVEDYNAAIKVCKDAIEKFKLSPFIGTYYRQLGRAYMKVDRDQTAEKTFYTGLGVIDKKMAEMRKSNTDGEKSDEYSRLKDDKVGILISLKNLHTTYKALDKLADVEQKLKELGR
jgi:tetratricopeptide (TPR) repeat protein